MDNPKPHRLDYGGGSPKRRRQLSPPIRVLIGVLAIIWATSGIALGLAGLHSGDLIFIIGAAIDFALAGIAAFFLWGRF
jgi:hypothetical protein